MKTLLEHTHKIEKKKKKKKNVKKIYKNPFILVAFTVVPCMRTRRILCLKKNNLRADGWP